MMTIEEIEQLAQEVRGCVNKIYLHWSAGSYNGVSDHYHINIKGDGEIVVTGALDEVKPHTFARNTRAVGVSLCCLGGNNVSITNNDLGDYPPTEIQINRMAEVIAALARGLDIPIDKFHVMTHGEAANNEDGGTSHLCYAWWNDEYGDGNTRGDLEFLGTPESPKYNPYATDGTRGGDVLRGKAIFYLNQMNGTPQEVQQTPKAELPEVKIWKFFKSKGLNDYAVAGIMGNLYVESGLLPDNLQDSFHNSLDMNDEEYTNAIDVGEYSKEDFVNDKAGYGLAQWTYPTRKEGLYNYAKIKGRSIGDLNTQLEFLWGELSEYEDLMGKLRNAKSVREASDAFLLDFERPADQGEGQRSRRANYAQEFYEDNAIPTQTKKEDENMNRYDTIDEIPEWAKDTIQKLIDKGFLKNASLDLSLDMIRIFVVNDRAGVYGV